MQQSGQHRRLTVIGAGSWGTALANLLATKGYRVTLWARDNLFAQQLAHERENTLYLPGVPLHPNVTPTAAVAEAVQETMLLISAVPSHAVRTVWSLFAPLLPAAAVLVSTTKGIEAGSLLTMSQVLRETLEPERQIHLAVLSGPTFAREVSRNTPTAAVVAASNRHIAEEVQQVFSTPTFRIYTSTDVLGVEIGGALKNVIALAAGVCDGLDFGHNTRAALITRGLAEITHLGIAMGAMAETFAGLSGMGDLVLTCTGDLSRNHAVGVRLGQGQKLSEVLAQMRMVAEGVTTAGSAVALGVRHQVEMPIAEKVHALLHGHIAPHEAVVALMTRALKHEGP